MRYLAWVASLVLVLGFILFTYETRFAPQPSRLASPLYPGNGPLPRGGGHYVVGQPYEVAGRWYSPADQPNYDEVGTASWYGPQFDRHETANGEWFDMDYLTAAHTTLPLPSYVRVTNVENGKALVVRVNDRGPFVGDRIIDLSRKAAETLKMKDQGTARVRVQYIGPAPLDDNGTDLAARNSAFRAASIASEKPAATKQEPLLADASLITGSLPVTAGETKYAVQVGVFTNLANADRTRSRLADIGPVEISTIATESDILFQVRIGPMTDAARAREALQQVIGAGYKDAKVVTVASPL
jgi:rare lipoprotein A